MIIPYSFMKKKPSTGSCANVSNTTTSVLASGSGSDTNAGLSNYWIRSFTSQIYTSAEMGGAKQITALQFYNSLADSSDWGYTDVVIRMAHCTGTSHSAASFVGTFPNQAIAGVAGVTDETVVHSGFMFKYLPQGWVSFGLDTNFCYDGTSNLVIQISKKQTGSGGCSTYSSGCGYASDYTKFRYTNDGSGANTGAWYENDYSDPTGLSSTGSGTNADINNFRTQLRVEH